MTLTDLFPDGEAFWKATHGGDEDKTQRDARIARLKPLTDQIRRCISECGPCTADASSEYSLLASYLCVMDRAIEQVTTAKFQV